LLQTSFSDYGARTEASNSNSKNNGKHNDNYNNSGINITLMGELEAQHISGKEIIDYTQINCGHIGCNISI
jgi:hypothetical protein